MTTQNQQGITYDQARAVIARHEKDYFGHSSEVRLSAELNHEFSGLDNNRALHIEGPRDSIEQYIYTNPDYHNPMNTKDVGGEVN